MAKASWNGVVIAESSNTVIVEGNHYFPKSSIKSEYFQANSRTSVCPWKGTASYFDITVDGQTNKGAAWIYPEPKEAAKNITDHVAFWHGVVVEQ